MKNIFKLKPSSIILLLLFVFFDCYAQNFNWLISGGGTAFDIGYYVKTDSTGNSYVTGSFSQSAVFGSFTVNGVNGSNMYIAKYDSAGVCKWVRTAPGFGSGIDFDSKGYIYVGGQFNGMVAKYDSLGNLLRTIPGQTYLQVEKIAIYDRYIISTGTFSNSVNFGSTTLTATGPYDAFLVCYDTSGVFQWAKKYGTPAPEYSRDIRIDKNGNSYFTGYSITASGWQIFLIKYNIAGEFQWEKTSSASWNSNESWTIDIDQDGNVYMGGRADDIIFDGHILSGSFVAKIHPDGTVLWAKQIAENTADLYALRFDYNGHFYITGTYGYDATFGNTTLPYEGNTNCYIAKYDTSGNCILAKHGYISPIPHGSVVGMAISFDKWSNVYICGIFGTYNSNPYSANFGDKTVAGPGYTDLFLLKMEYLWVNTAPTIQKPPTITVCEDSGPVDVLLTKITAGVGENQNLTITANSDNTLLLPHLSVTYSGGSTGHLTLSPAAGQTGMATVTLTVNDGELINNTTSVQFTVHVLSPPQAFSLSILNQDSIELSGSQIGFYYQLIDSSQTVIAVKEGTGGALVFADLPDGVYSVIVKETSASCSFMMNGSVVILHDSNSPNPPGKFIPNLITANKDGANEKFSIDGFPYPPSLKIFNRWGELVFQNAEYNNDWPEESHPEGIYFYFLVSGDKEYKGWLQIIR